MTMARVSWSQSVTVTVTISHFSIQKQRVTIASSGFRLQGWAYFTYVFESQSQSASKYVWPQLESERESVTVTNTVRGAAKQQGDLLHLWAAWMLCSTWHSWHSRFILVDRSPQYSETGHIILPFKRIKDPQLVTEGTSRGWQASGPSSGFRLQDGLILHTCEREGPGHGQHHKVVAGFLIHPVGVTIFYCY